MFEHSGFADIVDGVADSRLCGEDVLVGECVALECEDVFVFFA